MTAKMLAVAVLVCGSVLSANAQRNADIPRGPAGLPSLDKSPPKAASEPVPKESSGVKNGTDNKRSTPAGGDALDGAGKATGPARGK